MNEYECRYFWQKTIVINGREYLWHDTEVVIRGVVICGITTIEYVGNKSVQIEILPINYN